MAVAGPARPTPGRADRALLDRGVIVVGGGVAGMSAAIALAEAGVDSVVLERGDDSGERVGESLPPSSRPLLAALDVLDTMADDGHLPCHGNRSAWGSESLDEYDFLRSPYGHGWHVDRRRFEARLAQRGAELGQTRHTGAVIEAVHRVGGHWHVTVHRGRRVERYRAPFLVDATGRTAAIARDQGARRVRTDALTALVAFLRTDSTPDPDSFTLVEAVQSGWWYSATLPDRRLAVAHFTDGLELTPTLHDPTSAWHALLRGTRHTRARVTDHGYRLCAPPWVTDAGASHLDTVAGEGWLAVGDAACTFDPLSSHGMVHAMSTGLAAAKAISESRAGAASAMDHYARGLGVVFGTYRRRRRGYYALEHRWRDQPFWRARRVEGTPDREA